MMNENEILNPKEGDFPCRNLSIEMNYPKSKSDIEAFLFYIYHEDVEAFIGHDGEWYIRYKSICSHLTKDKKCGIKNRQADECTQHGTGNKKIKDVARFHFKTEYDLVIYLKEHRPALFKKLYSQTQKIAYGKRPKEKKPKKTKGTLPPGIDTTHACFECITCCSYLNIIVDKPTGTNEAKSLLGYIYHSGSDVYLDKDKDWSILIKSECQQLTDVGFCSIYDRRSAICRQFSEKNCHGINMNESVQEYFKTDKALMEFFSKKRHGLFKKFPKDLQKKAK